MPVLIRQNVKKDILVLPTRSLWTLANTTTQLWLDGADASVFTSSGGIISQWRDKSGKARHVTGVGSPALTANVLNGLSAVRLNGSSHFNNASDNLQSNNAGELNVYAVVRRTVSTNGVILTHRNSTTYRSYGYYASTFISSDGADAASNHQIGGADIAKSLNYSIHAFKAIVSSRMALSINGTAISVTTGTCLNANGSAGFQVGAITGGTLWDGDICELAVTTTNIDEAKIGGSLAWKWGLVSELPSNHLFKNSPPMA